ncbi:hypothetical protein FOS14_10890 [Skermania sp. ID1734]|uniref:DUF6230 family protein n=1 Tax=Skermania sp. ID1734 TaxID=2597516 RepID=UPI00117F199B|nr:DUF6230 family protein [Skermania sp. ID1734]TSD99756.1 hypothetical protein FOS14_10890 [Skermania sp. ID1734]
MMNGALATTITATQAKGTLTTSGLQGTGLGAVVKPVPVKDSSGKVHQSWVARFGLQHASVKDLCITEKASLLGQVVTLMVTVGGPNTPADIELGGVILDAYKADARIVLKGTTAINKNGRDVAVAGSPITLDGQPDEFGLQSEAAELQNVTGTISTIQVPAGLSAPSVRGTFAFGDRNCPTPS